MGSEVLRSIIDASYPSYEGWQRFSVSVQDGLSNFCIGYKRNGKCVIVIIRKASFVTRHDLESAKQLQKNQKEHLSGCDVHVLLVYDELLARPQRIPEGVSVTSVGILNKDLENN